MSSGAPGSNGYGRLYAADPGDKNFPLETREFALRLERIWPATTSNQGQQPICVGHGWRNMLTAAPQRWTGVSIPTALEIYVAAQQVDGLPGPPPPYPGTTVRAGAKVLQRLGFLKEYRWAKNIRQVKFYTLNVGPLVLGTPWFLGMAQPKYIKNRRTGRFESYIEPTGEDLGGHCTLLIGYSYWRQAGLILNSHGEEWGDQGRAWMPIDGLDYCIFRANGEACSAIEN